MMNAELRERLLVLMADGEARYHVPNGLVCHKGCARAELQRMEADGLVDALDPADITQGWRITTLGEDAAREVLVPQCLD